MTADNDRRDDDELERLQEESHSWAVAIVTIEDDVATFLGAPR